MSGRRRRLWLSLVIAVSLPGYGFSDKPGAPGFSPERMGAVVATLMKRLGYERYGVQGGDWGSVVGRMAALNDAPHVAGLHLNFCTAGAPPGTRRTRRSRPPGSPPPRDAAGGWCA